MTGLRLDKWLWFARFARTRSLAARLCSEGAVAIGGAVIVKPGHPVRVGDVLTVRQGRMRREITVLALAARRGPPEEARRLYAEATPPVPLAAAAPSWVPLIEE
ncbi:MAG TPA: RNA-binding S4 domain-containing protein [Stellaceae bacterium]|nr:RNA-binding S4 domain-containing protein [Stellaceae bacterium]